MKSIKEAINSQKYWGNEKQPLSSYAVQDAIKKQSEKFRLHRK